MAATGANIQALAMQLVAACWEWGSTWCASFFTLPQMLGGIWGWIVGVTTSVFSVFSEVGHHWARTSIAPTYLAKRAAQRALDRATSYVRVATWQLYPQREWLHAACELDTNRSK